MAIEKAQINEIKNLMRRIGENIDECDIMTEYYDCKANGHGPQIIEEETIRRILDKHGKEGFVVISANRTDMPQQENNENTRSLIQDIRATGHSYLPVYGGYKGSDGVVDKFEPSFVVFNYDRKGEKTDFSDLEKFAVEMCGKYRQDSVLVVRPGEKALYLDKDGAVTGEEGDTPPILNDPTQQYFTSLIKTQSIDKEHPERSKRWTYDMHFNEGREWNLYSNPNPCTLTEMMKRDSWGEVLLRN